jgi:hypothetical protein
MKLAGPSCGVRFVLGVCELRAVVCGVFPPERAPAARVVAQQLADAAYPEVHAAWQRENRRMLDELLYGTPGASEPRGILRGRSCIESALST